MQFSNIENKEISLKEITLLGEKVQVKQYLPMADKQNILEMVIQTADAGTILNTLVLDAVFEIYLVFKYTDIEFTEEEKVDLLGTYDKLENNGVIETIIKEIPQMEYKILRDNLNAMIVDYKDYRNSAKGFLDTLMIFAPSAAEKFNEAIEQMDTDKVQNVVAIANAAGFRKK